MTANQKEKWGEVSLSAGPRTVLFRNSSHVGNNNVRFVGDGWC